MTPRPARPVPVVDLDEIARGKRDVGAKAAALARARRRGLPVLPGVVVPAAEGRRLVAAAAPVRAEAGPHAATLAVMDAARELDLSAVVAAARALGDRLVVRSSSAFEDDASWSGAFSSFLDVSPDEVPTAVAGCWASACAPTVLELCARMGRTPEEVCPAVLVQPMVAPEAGGTARVPAPAGGGAAAVEIVGVRGSPAPLLAGWVAGWRTVVAGGAAPEGTPDAPAPGGGGERGVAGPEPGPLPARWLDAVAHLARLAGDGAPAAIEWAIVEGRPLLLQLRVEAAGALRDEEGEGRAGPGHGLAAGGQSPRTPHGGAGPHDEPAFALAASPGAPAVARALLRYGGPLGEELVLPWLLAGHGAGTETGRRYGPAPAPLGESPGAFDATVAAARTLVARALGPAGAAMAGVAEGDPAALDALVPVPEDAGRAVLAGLAAVARRLVETGVLAHDEELWALSAAEVRAHLEDPAPGRARPSRYRLARWLPLLEAVMARWGRVAGGEGASPGTGAGRVTRLHATSDLRRVVPGDVVVVERPAPPFAPALWAASALVAETGSAAAHLAEVARSVRVPAVVATGPLDVADGRSLVLVDGDAGRVLVLEG